LTLGTRLLARGYLATSVDHLVTLLLAKYAPEVAKALPGDKSVSYARLDKPHSARLTALG